MGHGTIVDLYIVCAVYEYIIPDLEADDHDGAFSNMAQYAHNILSDEHAGEDVSVMSDGMGTYTVEDREGVPGEDSMYTYT